MNDALKWMNEAACAGLDPPIFFDRAYDDGNPARSRRESGLQYARSICARCPVQSDCLEYALANRERFGIWAGTTPPERAALLKQRARAKTASLPA